MTVEAGARGAIVAPDEKSLQWVFDHAKNLSASDQEAMKAYVKELYSDPQAQFDKEVCLDASAVKPMVTWGTSPDQCVAFDEPVPAADSFEDPVQRAAAVRYRAAGKGLGKEAELREIHHLPNDVVAHADIVEHLVQAGVSAQYFLKGHISLLSSLADPSLHGGAWGGILDHILP